MPAYFFHLAFELSQRPAGHLPRRLEDNSSGNSSFQPRRNHDIFDTNLPAHRASTWTSYLAPRCSLQRSKPDAARFHEERFSRDVTPRVPGSQESGKQEKTLLDKSNKDLARSKAPIPVRSPVEEDWRFDSIEVESVDMLESSTAEGPVPDRTETAIRNSTDVALKGKFIPSEPKTTELGWGVVHLYRDTEPAPELEDASSYASSVDRPSRVDFDDHQAFVDRDCTTLCMLAVPTYMTPSDLLGWLGEETREQVLHFRLVRSARSNKYMVLMKFRDPKVARGWQQRWNGKLFNSTEPENCHVVFVKSIQFQTPDAGRDPSSFPDMSNDPFTPTAKQNGSNANISNPESSHWSNSPLSTKPAPPPTPSLLELPTCPVCLERMDDTTGLATIFCQHVFHCACLSKWKGSGCPVCRYTQNDPRVRGKVEDEYDNQCHVCGSTSNPWICLICGHVGCGRYDGAHAFAHYEQTFHTFAMDVATQHVWDYAGDGYVHRLIQNKSDGKLVELPSAAIPVGATGDEMVPRDKMENMSLEYTYLLTSQLDSQRLYFEEQVDRAVDKAAKASAAAEAAAETASAATRQLSEYELSQDALLKTTVPLLERERERAQRRAEKFETTARKMEKEWREKEVINDSLMDRISHLEKQLDEATGKNGDLEEQNRDLSFFISGLEKLKDQGEDVQEGTLTVAEAPRGGAKKKKKKKGKPAAAA